MRTMPRRVVFAVLAALVIVLGMLSRTSLLPAESFLGRYAGDTLWALMVYLLLRVVVPQQPILYAALIAAGFSYAIEFSQLYQAEWINALRRTLPGRLILGAGFLWSDLLCYTVGILVGALGEWAVSRWRIRRR